MGEHNERNVYRIIVFVVLILGALGVMWLIAQDGGGVGDQGIFQFFSDPMEPARTPNPGE